MPFGSMLLHAASGGGVEVVESKKVLIRGETKT